MAIGYLGTGSNCKHRIVSENFLPTIEAKLEARKYSEKTGNYNREQIGKLKLIRLERFQATSSIQPLWNTYGGQRRRRK